MKKETSLESAKITMTREWLEKEKEADRDIANGDVIGPFDNIDDALKALKNAKI